MKYFNLIMYNWLFDNCNNIVDRHRTGLGQAVLIIATSLTQSSQMYPD